MELIDLTSNKTFHALRVAAEFVMVASESSKNNFNIKERRTVDDEHTPGTFKLVDIVSPDGENGTQGNQINPNYSSNFIMRNQSGNSIEFR